MTDLIALSKTLCFVLRHRPQALGLTVDAIGSVSIRALLDGFRLKGKTVSNDDIVSVAANDDKQRFHISADGLRIRAVQGHSYPVSEAAYESATPPAVLYHGTATGHLESIFQNGLNPQSRQFVHLTDHIETARLVGIRYRKMGEVVILRIDTAKLLESGSTFYRALNGVWLVKHVPSTALSVYSD